VMYWQVLSLAVLQVSGLITCLNISRKNVQRRKRRNYEGEMDNRYLDVRN